ncbi:MAG: HAD family hydrolase [Bacteriovoracaceae bacterium]|nr:HAD family hydrolase [Bacteriovoracaceae bacterium]
MFENLPLNSIFKKINDTNRDDFPTYKIAILRNITLESIKPYVEYHTLKQKLRPSFYFCEFDNIMQNALDSQSKLYQLAPDLIIIAINGEILSNQLYQNFISLDKNEVNDKLEFIKEHFRNTISAIRRNSNTPILIHSLETPTYPSLGILDYQCINYQINSFRKVNMDLISILQEFEKTYLIDLDLIKARLGENNFKDQRYWHIGKAPFSKDAYFELAKEYSKFISALNGRSKKCIVLDLDNTLWGGIIGEDGIENIKLGKSYPGSAFLEFQNMILDLYSKGVLLAICSKNNYDDAIEALSQHPEMILRPEQFVSIKTNWNDKASNIKDIASELNIGLDSIVFIDDNKFETNLVANQIPEVTAVTLPEDPSGYVSYVKSLDLFNTLSLTSEDKKRSTMYHAESKRKTLKQSTTNIEDYLKSLEMCVTILTADKYSTPRIAQLTQRTNQFNLTTKRYTDSDIENFMSSNSHDVLYLKLNDNFGDSGIVGVAILNHKNNETVIDSLMLSCRVIGRGVEDIFLQSCILKAMQRNSQRVLASYHKTAKNSQVKTFYSQNGFDIISKDEESSIFAYDKINKQLNIPNYFKTIDTTGADITWNQE